MTTNSPAGDSKSVFLVDDDSSALSLYSSRLEQAGFRTASVSHTADAFNALPGLTADLIILDLMLPKRESFELLKAIRANDRHKHTPVLILSNSYLPEMAQKALKAGGSKALSKSECSPSELVAVSRALAGVTETPPLEVASWEQVTNAFFDEVTPEMAALRQYSLRFAEVAGTAAGGDSLEAVYRSVRFLSTRAGLAGCRKIAQLSGAIEAMLFDQMSRSNGAMSQSSIQTLNQSVECLGKLFTNRDSGAVVSSRKASVLLVDDDRVCNMANAVALQRANYSAASATNGSEGLNLLFDQAFDLVLLDIDMPGMNGIELCQKLRGIPHHKNTPVIFVTLHSDFQNRFASLSSGGDDLISKPISPLELIVKATVFLVGNSKFQAPGGHSTDDPAHSLATGQSGADGAGNKSPLSPLALGAKFKYLKQALAEETKQRAAVEAQAAEHAKRRADLEAAIEENQRSQEMFRRLLEESRQQAQATEQGGAGGQLHSAGRRRALEELENFVADKLFRLKKALAEETKRREAIEQQVAENASRRAELEAALSETQKAEQSFQQELASVEDLKPLRDLEASLAESQKAREQLSSQLEAALRELETLRARAASGSGGPGVAAEITRLEARIQEMTAARDAAEQQVGKLKAALAAENERREAIKQRAVEYARCRGELEAALAQNDHTGRALQQAIEASENAKRRGELEAELADNKRVQA